MENIKILSSQDISYLTKEYPNLEYDSMKNVIRGILHYNITYKHINIVDKYNIEINLNCVSDLGMPIIRETSGRILNIAQVMKIDPVDLHLNKPNGELCIIIPPKIKEKYPNGFDLSILLEHIQEHFYWVSYYEKYGKEPWRAFSHDEKGYLELFLEDKKYKEDVMAYFKCNYRSEFRRKIKELKKKYKI